MATTLKLMAKDRISPELWYRIHRLTRGEDWCRVRMDQHIDQFLRTLNPEESEAADISASHPRPQRWKRLDTPSYPKFDLCDGEPAERTYDVVMCEQVLEHVVDPFGAGRKLLSMLRPGGTVVVSVPFMVRIHAAPSDYWRFTEEGLRILLENAGFVEVETHSWGNRKCVTANFDTWKRYWPWHSLANEKLLPFMIWAYGKRPS
jgi:hypothetical protein